MTAEGPLSAVAGWLALLAGAIGVVVTGLVYALRGRFRGGTLGKGFGLWTLAILLWAASMLQEGVMHLFLETPYTELLHQVLMVGGLVLGLAGTWVFYGVGRTRPAGA